MENKPGFLQNAYGEKSSTKLFNMVYGVILMIVWAALCWNKKEILPIDPTAIIPLGIGHAVNSINKWTEFNSNTEQAKFIKAVMSKVVNE